MLCPFNGDGITGGLHRESVGTGVNCRFGYRFDRVDQFHFGNFKRSRSNRLRCLFDGHLVILLGDYGIVGSVLAMPTPCVVPALWQDPPSRVVRQIGNDVSDLWLAMRFG